jgi:hypothetical protein
MNTDYDENFERAGLQRPKEANVSQHTAGPWFVVKNGDKLDVHARIAPIGEDLREISIARNLGSVHDARLIAAAPELLEASIMAVSCFDTHGTVDNQSIADLRDAIAKATS